jgi:6-pyruvoyltetrahydropterin/6-carboxytetrahydropterin synthase
MIGGMEVFKKFRFEAAHRLAHLPAGHPCHRLHGHSYEVVVRVQGPMSPTTGFVVDFAEIDDAMRPLLEALDHRDLNAVDGLRLTTAEEVAHWLWERLAPRLGGLAAVEVWESPTAGCVHRGD